MDFVILLAGGKGTRLWPASVESRPKQFVPLVNGKSLFQLSLSRAAALAPARGIIVVSLAEQEELVRKDLDVLAEIPVPVYMVPEPAGRNTAPAITAAVLFAEKQAGGRATALVLTSDHLIGPDSVFITDCRKAEALASAGYLTVFGIRPRRPETGYGYIEAGPALQGGRKVLRFHEKPDSDTAKKYCRTGDYYWNSGMFAFSLRTYLAEAKKQAGAVLDAFAPCSFGGGQSGGGLSVILNDRTFRECYTNMPSISVDYAIMEKCEKAALVEAGFEWNDLGSWDEIAVTLADKLENSVVIPENPGNFIYSDIPVSVQGLDDLIVIIKNGKCLICPKGKSQDVKKTVEEIREQGLDDLL